MAVTKQELEDRVKELEEHNEALVQELAGAAPSAPEGPHVLTAIQTILGRLSVEKGGTLPQNMGGKPYISAVDLNLEVKRLFVEQKLVIVPSEHVTHFETLEVKGRQQTFLVIEGKYQIISSVDGTSVTIGGVGDGTAIGSAVTANIASTNALKNALLRFFLVTEQSVEDAAKETPQPKEGAAPQGDRAQQAAQAGPRAVPQPVQPQPESDYKRRIREDFIDSGVFTKEQVNTVMDQVKAIEEFRGGDKLLPEVHRRLATGEVPE